MARQLFEIEKGLRITQENTTNSVDLLSGDSAPDGISGGQGDASIGSLYIRRVTGELYQKIANAGSSADYKLISQGSLIISYRPELVRARTADTVTSGVARDLTASPFSDDEGTQLTASDFAVGEYLIADNTLYEVTDVSAPNVTFSTTGVYSPMEGDTFFVANDLTDSPGTQENQALVVYNGTSFVKIADVDFGKASAVTLDAGYTAGSGDVTSGESVLSAIQKLDGNNDAQDSVLGTAQGDTDLGTFTGSTITDANTVKGALQELETAHEETDANVDDLITLSGVAENSTSLGTFAGAVITDNNTVKGALSELEAKDESQDSIITEIDNNVDDLISLSGVAENTTNLGAFTGFGAILLTATETIKSAIQKITDFLGHLRNVETNSITVQTDVDSVPVASVKACKWFIQAEDSANPNTNLEALEVYALNNGTVADFNDISKLRIGSKVINVDVDISAGNMRLRATPQVASINVRVRRISVVDA